MKRPKPIQKRLRLPPPRWPDQLITDVYGGEEDQPRLDRQKDAHNAKVMRDRAAWDAWLRDYAEPSTKN